MLRHAALLVLSLAVVGLVALSYSASAEHRAELVGGYEDGAANYYGACAPSPSARPPPLSRYSNPNRT